MQWRKNGGMGRGNWAVFLMEIVTSSETLDSHVIEHMRQVKHRTHAEFMLIHSTHRVQHFEIEKKSSLQTINAKQKCKLFSFQILPQHAIFGWAPVR